MEHNNMDLELMDFYIRLCELIVDGETTLKDTMQELEKSQYNTREFGKFHDAYVIGAKHERDKQQRRGINPVQMAIRDYESRLKKKEGWI